MYVIFFKSSDPYFESGKKEEVHDVTNRNTLLSIYPNGLVFYSQRITLTHWCHVDLTYFPLDYQYCEVKLLTCMDKYCLFKVMYVAPFAL